MNDIKYSLPIAIIGAAVLASSSVCSAAVIRTIVTPTNAAYASGGGAYTSGAPVTVTAVLTNDCYYFLGWTSGSRTASTNLVYSFTASSNVTVTAKFARYLYKVRAVSQPPNGGTNSGAGTKACGATAIVSAHANPGFRFANWTDGGTVVSTNPVYRFMVTKEVVLTVNYLDIAPPTFAIVSPPSGRTTTNDTVTVTGKAVDKVSVTNVFYNASGSGWTAAETTNGWTNWSATVPLGSGTNRIQLYASDGSGNNSSTRTLLVIKVPAWTSFLVATGSNIRAPQAQSAFDGTNYLVVFQTHNPQGSGTPTAQLISSAGSLVTAQLQIPVQGGADPPCVAFDGTNYLMIWADPENNVEGSGIHGQFVTTSGQALGDRFVITESETISSYNTLLFGAGVYFMMWADSRSDPDAVYGAMLSPSGDIAVPDFEISPNGTQVEAGQTSAAFDGNNFLATWSCASGHASVMGRLIAPDGSFVTESFVIYTNPATTGLTLNCVAFDGTKYLVLFNSGLNPASLGSTSHINGRFVSTSGEVLTNRLVITRNTGPQILAGAAFDGTHYLITWNQGLNPFSPTLSSAGIRGRLFDINGNPAVAEFTLFPPAGARIPLWAPVLFDGTRFLTTVGYGQPLGGLKFSNGIIRAAFVSP